MIIPDWFAAPFPEVGPHVRLSVLTSRDDLYRHFAEAIVSAVQEACARRGKACLILPVGPTAHYPFCAELFNASGVDLNCVTIVHMDEYLDENGQLIPVDHPLSFRGVMQRLFYSKLDTSKGQPQVLYPSPQNIGIVADFIEQAGGVDAAFGGIGIHGHVAFNEPLDPSDERNLVTLPPRIVALRPETITMNASRAFGGYLDGFPTQAVTIGIPQLLNAGAVTLYADGGVWQRTAIRYAVRGKEDPRFPVTLLTSRREVTLVTDTVGIAPICD